MVRFLPAGLIPVVLLATTPLMLSAQNISDGIATVNLSDDFLGAAVGQKTGKILQMAFKPAPRSCEECVEAASFLDAKPKALSPSSRTELRNVGIRMEELIPSLKADKENVRVIERPAKKVLRAKPPVPTNDSLKANREEQPQDQKWNTDFMVSNPAPVKRPGLIFGIE